MYYAGDRKSVLPQDGEKVVSNPGDPYYSLYPADVRKYMKAVINAWFNSSSTKSYVSLDEVFGLKQ